MTSAASLFDAPTSTPVVHEMTTPRSRGTVNVEFGRHPSGRRQIRFGGEHFGDDSQEITVFGKPYRVSATVVEVGPGRWETPVSHDLIRNPTGMRSPTPKARKLVRCEFEQAAGRLAEVHGPRFDAGTRARYRGEADGLANMIAGAALLASALREEADIVGLVASGAAAIRPLDRGGRHSVSNHQGIGIRWEAFPYSKSGGVPQLHTTGHAEVTAEVVLDGETIAYVAGTGQYETTVIPVGWVTERRDRDRDRRW